MRVRSGLSLFLVLVSIVFCGGRSDGFGGRLLIAQATPVAAADTAAGGKRPMTFADMMQLRRLGDTDVSPNGKWLVYSVTDVDLAKNTKTATLWIQPVAGGEAKRLSGTEPGDGGAHFSADGKRLLFLSDRGGHEQVWVAEFDDATGEARSNRNLMQANKDWTAGNADAAKSNGDASEPRLGASGAAEYGLDADNALWAPDGRSIVFTAAVYPDCPAIGSGASGASSSESEGEKCNADRDAAQAASKVKARIFEHLLYKHWNAFTGDKRSHLFLLTVTASGGPSDRPGAIRDLTPNDPHDVPPFSLEGGGGFAFSPDSKELAFTENLDAEPAISTNADIFTLDLTDRASKPVKVSTSPGGDFNPAYSPDGKYLAWRSQARAGYESDKFRLVIYDRVGKSIKDLLPKFDRWVDEFAWGPDSKRIYFVSGDAGEARVFKTDLEGQAFVLTHGGEYSDVRPTSNGASLVASRMTAQQPSEGVVLSVDADTLNNIASSFQHGIVRPAIVEPTQITHLNDSLLARIDLAPVESFSFTVDDKSKVQGFLIKPPGFDAGRKYPVKFLIHGGPQGAWGDSWSYRWNAELFAANGYVVIMINPRGSTGYGQAFVDGVNGDWGGKPYTDLMMGLDYAEKTYPFIDKNRECALGASYGGYMANWVLGHTNRFKCIVSHDGMFNPESAYGSTEELWFNEWEFKTPNTNGGRPWDNYDKPDAENLFRKWSPALYAKHFKTPTLVVHSQLDYRLDVSEGYQLFTTLQRLRVPSKMLYFPDEGHWVLKPQNSELWYKTVNDWVDEWTRPKVTGNKDTQ